MSEAPRPLVSTAHAHRRGLLFAFGAILIWSFWPVWTRHGVTQSLAPEDIVALRFGVGGALFLPFLLLQARRIPRRAWLAGLGLAVCQGAPFVLLVAIGLRFAPANHASLTPGTTPLFAAILSAIAFAQPVPRARLFGLVLLLAGAAVLATSGAGAAVALGDLFFLAGAAIVSVYIVCVARSGLTAFQAAAMVSVLSMIFYLPLHLALGLGKMGSAPLAEIVQQGVYQGVFMAFASFILFNSAIGLLGSAQVSALVALVPVLTMGFAATVLGEQPSLGEFLSILLISAGVYFAAQLRAPARGLPARTA